MNHHGAQRKAGLAALASGLILMLVIGGELLRANPTTSANNAATATALSEVQQTQIAVRLHNHDKDTQEAILELTGSPPPTPTPFDKLATLAAMEQLLTQNAVTSPTPRPTEPNPVFQRPAGVGRLVLPGMGICGFRMKCIPEDLWIEKTKDKFITVYAGTEIHIDGSIQAELAIEWDSLSDRMLMPGGREFPVPFPSQDVKIVDVIGEQLTLRTDDGTLLFFDVPSQQYISLPPSQLTARKQHPIEVGEITEDSNVPFTLPGFSAVNRWSGKNAQGRITVFAGAEGGISGNSDRDKGRLAVVTFKGEPTATDVPQVYSLTGPYPERGALWIFDVKGNRVALLDEVGNKFFFDLTTRQSFSESDDRAKIFTAPLAYENLPLAQATPALVTPFVPPPPVSTPVSNAYP